MDQLPLAVSLLFAAPLGALFISFFLVRPFKPQWTHWPILISCAVVSIAAVSLAAQVYAGGVLDTTLWTWMLSGNWGISFGVRIDGLSASVLAMVAVVGALIHLYAAGYMKEDPGFSRFFLLFHLFYLAMIGLLVSNNYVQLYFFWEMVGMASYFLIGFWHQKQSARRAAMQAFLVNRVGDFGLMLGVLLLLALFPQSHGRFADLFPAMGSVISPWLTAAGFLLFWAATAKSAQFPLYFWLPDAMEGPTPVSALMHAATMVTAGIFLLARSWPLIVMTPHLPHLIAWVGAGTALASAIIAATRKDLKRILAYSTVSHLGLMAMALGVGAVGAAIFHLIVHGFFKATLFLCAGNIAHGLGKSAANVDEVGGLKKKMPLTFACFTVAALSLSGIWPFAGFYSKDAILDAALKFGPALGMVGLLIGAASAFYIFRMLFLVFFGNRPNQKNAPHIHEAGPEMAIPVLFIAVGALGAGWLASGVDAILRLGWLGALPPSLPQLSLSESWRGLAMATLGVVAAYWLTQVRQDWDWQWRRHYPGLESFFDSDFGWKPLMTMLARLIGRAAHWIGNGFDKGIWDGLIESLPGAAQGASNVGASLATGSVNDYLWWMAVGAAVLLLSVVVR